LLGFGIASFIEITSGALVGWRPLRELHRDGETLAARIERRVSRLAGGLLLLLAAYIVFDASRRLLGYAPEAKSSAVGIIVTAVAALLPVPIIVREALEAIGLYGADEDWIDA
jgi:hypothetical protein